MRRKYIKKHTDNIFLEKYPATPSGVSRVFTLTHLSKLSHPLIIPHHFFPHRILRQLHVTVQFHRILYMGRPLRKHQPENGIRSFFPFPLRFRHGQPVNILGQMPEGCRNGITDVPGAFPLPAVLVPIHPAFEPGQIHPPFSENRL